MHVPPAQISERTRHARRLFAALPARYDALAEVLSFGQNARWRRFLLSRVPADPGSTVLDVATGTGAVALRLAGRGSRVVGVDQSEPMLREAARRSARSPAGARVALVLGQGERLPFADARFDAVTFTYLLRYVDDPAATLGELARVLRPGGTLACVEFHVPPHPVWRAAWWCYTRAGLPLAGRLASPAWADVGRFLGPSISGFVRRYPLPRQLAMWREAGIGDARGRTMSLGGGVVIWGTRA